MRSQDVVLSALDSEEVRNRSCVVGVAFRTRDLSEYFQRQLNPRRHRGLPSTRIDSGHTANRVYTGSSSPELLFWSATELWFAEMAHSGFPCSGVEGIQGES